MSYIPFSNLLIANNISKAFIINSIVSGIIVSVGIIIQKSLDSEYKFINDLNNKYFGNIMLSEKEKLIILFFSTVFSSLIVYHFFLLTLGYGGGLLTSLNVNPIKYYYEPFKKY